MLKELLEKVSGKLKKPLLILGATGFSTTVVACYGPPAYKYNTELESGALEALTQCVDGTTSHERCDYGCMNGYCLKPGAGCHERYPELCGKTDLNRDKKLSCVDGKMVESDCANCHGGVSAKFVECGGGSEAKPVEDETPQDETPKEEN